MGEALRALVLMVTLGLGAGATAQPRSPAAQSGSMRARFEVRARTLRVLEISEALKMTEPEALKLSEVIGRFDERRNPLQREMQQNAQLLRRAAQGDASAFAQVDAAIARTTELRTQIQQVDREMFVALSQGLSPQRKAILSLTLARLPNELRDVARAEKREARREAREQGFGNH